jgi:endogenous inhibitor of DNA gyrase (YacG/DUF329 family)
MRCPICKKIVEPTPDGTPATAYPFCSDRCKLLDLGRWLDGQYQIELPDVPGEPIPDEP